MTITKRSNKKRTSYLITVYCGYDEMGKQVRKFKTYIPPEGLSKTEERKAVEEVAAAFERKIKGGSCIKYEKMTFERFCRGPFNNHLASLKPKTKSEYQIIIERRLIPCFGKMLLTSITPLDVSEWLATLERRDGKNIPLSSNSAGCWFRTLSAVLGKAYELGIIDENPCKRVKSPSKPQTDVPTLQADEVKTILSKLPDYHDKRVQMFILLMLNTGIREGEAAGLQWNDVFLSDGYISIVRTSQYIPGTGMIESTPKSRSSVRKIPISKHLVDEFIRYREWQFAEIKRLGPLYVGKIGEETRLFTTLEGKPIYDSTLRKWLKKFMTWCGMKPVSVHSLRHTTASLLVSNEVAPTDLRTVAAILGHSSPALVMNVYANPQNEAIKRAINNLDKFYNQDPN